MNINPFLQDIAAGDRDRRVAIERPEITRTDTGNLDFPVPCDPRGLDEGIQNLRDKMMITVAGVRDDDPGGWRFVRGVEVADERKYEGQESDGFHVW
jgi:hypothetical protein